MIFSATIVMTTATKNVDAIENHRLAVSPIDWSGSASAMASLVTSVRRLSSGVIERVDGEAGAHAGVGRRQARQRMASDAGEGGGARVG